MRTSCQNKNVYFRSERHFRQAEQLTRLLLIAAQRRLILAPVEHALQHLSIAAVLRAGARVRRERFLIDFVLGLPGFAPPGLVEERRDEVARVVQVLSAVGATVRGDAHLVTLRVIPRTKCTDITVQYRQNSLMCSWSYAELRIGIHSMRIRIQHYKTELYVSRSEYRSLECRFLNKMYRNHVWLLNN
jgi:hypothetical protein